MYQDNLELTSKEILEKEFKIDTRGYRPQEVDAYLDLVIIDYNYMNKLIVELSEELNEKKEEINKLNKEIRNLKASVELKTDEKGITNLDILKRISDLEKKVYEE